MISAGGVFIPTGQLRCVTGLVFDHASVIVFLRFIGSGENTVGLKLWRQSDVLLSCTLLIGFM